MKFVDSVTIQDRGLAYGDGFFTTVLVNRGLPCFWSRHQQRILESARRLSISVDAAEIERRVRERLAKLTKSEAGEQHVLKLVITAGAGTRGYCRDGSEPQLLLSLAAYTRRPVGLKLMTCDTPASANQALAGIKHLNRLDNVLARAEVSQPFSEGVMTLNGKVIGGTMSNLFVRVGDRWLTPRLDEAGIAGITRGWLLEAADDFVCTEGELSEASLEKADELFATNALMGVVPVTQLNSRRFSIGRQSEQLRQIWTDTINSDECEMA